MEKGRSLLVIASAVMYAVAFLYSTYWWWLVFLFPIPLLYGASKDNVGFKYGFLWGLIIFLLHGIGGIIVVAHMAHQYWVLGMFLGLSIVIYQAVCVGIIFWLFQRCVHFFTIQTVSGKLCIATLTVAFVIFWIDRYCFCIFGVIEGYPLMHPLLILGHYPPLLFLLSIVGKQLLTMIFLCVSASVVSFLLFKNKIAAIGVVCGVLPWVLSVYLHSVYPVIQEPSWVKDIVAFPHMTLCKASYPLSMIKSIAQQMSTIVERYPHVQCIIMPESAFDSEVLLIVPDLLTLWGEQHIGRPVHVVFGAPRVCGSNYYNSSYWVYNGVLQKCCDKQHAMILSERIPQWLDGELIRSMYRAKGCCEVVCGEQGRLVLEMNGILFAPYLCSELFFNEYPYGLYNHQPIIALVNDSVFGQSYYSWYMQDLLVLLARFKAMMWQRDIVYVSYAHTLFINKQGEISQLQQ